MEFTLLDIDHKKDTVRLIGKIGERLSIFLIDYDFYVYIIPSPEYFDDVYSAISSLDFIKKTEIHNKKYLGKEYKVIKTFFNSANYQKLKELVDKLKEEGKVIGKKEADIPIHKKYIIDTHFVPNRRYIVKGKLIQKTKNYDVYILEDIKPLDENIRLKVIAFDIEAAAEKAIADPKKDKVISIALYGDGVQTVITWKKPNKFDKAIVVDNEYELFVKFNEILSKEKPDVLVGYNSNNFDIYFLYEKSKVLNFKFNFGFDGTGFIMTKKKEDKRFRIVGIQHVDIYQTIVNLFSSQLQSETYTLDEVSRELLGDQKVDLSYEDLYKLWNEGDIDKILEYNLKDAELTYKLFKYFENILLELARLTGMTLHEVSTATYGQLVESYLMLRSREFNEIIPNKPKPDEVEKRRSVTYKGAFVLEPKPGLYKNIAVYDFRSLYPSIIIRYNISFDTLRCEHSECQENNNIIIETSLGKETVWFCIKKRGMIPTVLEKIFKERIELKKKLKTLDKKSEEYRKIDAKQRALKTIINSMYGYLGFPNSRWYCLECAAAVTALGRKHILEIVELARSKGLTPIYGDTDSVFIIVNDENQVYEFLKEANKKLPDPLELELEDFYVSGIFVPKRSEDRGGAKKKYALLSKSGQIKLRGFEVVRRDWSPIAKMVQENVIKIILREQSKDKVIRYLQEIISKVKKKEYPLSMFIITEQLRKRLEDYKVDAPHVVAAKKYKQRGYDVRPGFFVEYVVCTGGTKISDKVRLPDECKNNNYDPEYYIDRQIIPAIEGILKALGISKAHITGKQRSVLEFFKKTSSK